MRNSKKVDAESTTTATESITSLTVLNPEKQNPLQLKVQNIARLQKLTVQLNSLENKRKELSSFEFSSDRTGDILQIEDFEGNKFQTSNTHVLNRVVETLKSEFAAKADQLETEILTATI